MKERKPISDCFVVVVSHKVTDKARFKCMQLTGSCQDFSLYLKELNLESLQDKCKTLRSFWNQLIHKIKLGICIPVTSTPNSYHMGNAQQEPNPYKVISCFNAAYQLHCKLQV